MIGMDSLRKQRGLMAKVASELGITRAAVATWKRVPAERVRDVARITGIAPHDLRPDLHDPPQAAQPDAKAA
jgi:DNA-binding transcriptional regulator YdaS (Cro superfamily)